MSMDDPLAIFARRTNYWRHESNALDKALSQQQATYDLTQSNPTKAGFNYPSHWLSALAQPKALVYEPLSFGLQQAREAVSDYYRRRQLNVDPQEIILTASSSESYAHLLRLFVNPHEKVLIPSPSYPLFPFLLDIHDAAYETYDLNPQDGWSIDRASLLRKLDGTVKIIMIVHPNNPTGSLISTEDKKWLIDLARQQQLILVVDEVFMDYHHGGCVDSFLANDGCLMFIVGGLSKTLCLPQMKLGWLIPRGSRQLVAEALARLDIMCDTYLSVNTPVQLAACQWLKDVDALQAQVHQRLAHNLAFVKAHLANGLHVEIPQAGWYVMVSLPSNMEDEDFCLRLLAKGVLVYPGYFFDMPNNHTVIISLLTATTDFEQGWLALCQMI